MKTQNGRDFYDGEVFKRYLAHREWAENPNDLIEKPVVVDLLKERFSGPVLDLGCGFGGLVDEILDRGATAYTGIDSSRQMLDLARSRHALPAVEWIKADITEWTYPQGVYETVTARLVFHYVADLSGLLGKIRESLVENGELIFSVEHPLLTSSLETHKPEEKKHNWPVDRYFNQGIRVHEWLGGSVIKYHRTVEDYWKLVTGAGFRVEALKEGVPRREVFKTNDEYERRQRIPLFLLMKAVKR